MAGQVIFGFDIMETSTPSKCLNNSSCPIMSPHPRPRDAGRHDTEPRSLFQCHAWPIILPAAEIVIFKHHTKSPLLQNPAGGAAAAAVSRWWGVAPSNLVTWLLPPLTCPSQHSFQHHPCPGSSEAWVPHYLTLLVAFLVPGFVSFFIGADAALFYC